ncbi:hypothetical protein BGZ80_006214, partial [Entomortierella chlamydospora]
MGVRLLWPFLLKNGYKPSLLHLSRTLLRPDCRFRIDVQGSIFSTICYAYSTCSTDDEAKSIVLRQLKKIANPSNSVLYLDGAPAEEKRVTHQLREEVRAKAIVAADKSTTQLVDRVNNNLRIRKQHFISIKKQLRKAFYWAPESRIALAQFLRNEGWEVIECTTEADYRIASDCNPGDVVISGDSDMLIYDNVSIIWRPISRGRFLVYDVVEVLNTLNINRTQLTVLGVVSHNDYNRNIYGLGCATNFSIIKDLKTTSVDASSMVAAYLADTRVILKNKDQTTFANSIKVFINGEQTPVPLVPGVLSSGPNLVTYDKTMAIFKQACDLYALKREEQREAGLTKKSSPPEERIWRHKPSQNFNRYRVIDRPPPKDNKAIADKVVKYPKSDMPSPKTPLHRPRYSFKTRTRQLEHEPPISMKQYTWKPWKEKPESPVDYSAEIESEPQEPIETPSTTTPTPVKDMNKYQLLRALSWEHPTVNLDIGTLSANVNGVLKDKDAVAQEVIGCIQEAVRLASEVKRQCQGLIGQYLELLDTPGVFDPSSDRQILDHLCPRIVPRTDNSNNLNVGEQNTNAGDFDDKGDKQEQFLASFLRFLYSGNFPSQTGVAKVANLFIKRLTTLNLLTPRSRSELNVPKEFNPTCLVRSVATQLAVELKKIYKNGSYELQEKLKCMKEQGRLIGDYNLEIRKEWSAIENFLALNKISKNSRRIAPMSSQEHQYMIFSERELLAFFWKRQLLKTKILEMTRIEFPNGVALDDLTSWIGSKGPGYLIKRLISDVAKEGLTKRQRGKAGVKAAVKLMAPDQIKEHLISLRQPTLDPQQYNTKGYLLRGSIRTDGFRIQLLAFKLKELQSVRYKRLPDDLLPPRITTTIGGTDYFLTEIRNIVKTKEDVTRLWPNCKPEEIKILGLDLGQACVIGASALLPDTARSIQEGKMKRLTEPNSSALTYPSSPSLPVSVFYNLAVKQKAVSQPTLKHRRWMEEQKSTTPLGALESVSDIETNLPPLRGEGTSYTGYVKELERVTQQLDDFYNGNNMRFKRHGWDARRARDAEFKVIANRLFKLVGGSIGCRRNEDNKV